MIFARKKTEYFFLFLGFFCFVHRLFTENSSTAICGCVFVSYSLISKDFNYQLSIVNMLVLCWCYVDLMLVLCRPYVGVMLTLCWCYVDLMLVLC